MIRIICDRCKSEVEHANKLYLDFRGFGAEGRIPGSIEVSPGPDLCDECVAWLTTIHAGWCTEKHSQQEGKQ